MIEVVSTALELDPGDVVALLEAFFNRLTEAKQVVDVHIAAGIALEDLEKLRQDGQVRGK